MIPDLDLFELSLWLAAFMGGPVVEESLSSTICSVCKNELKLIFPFWLHFIYTNQLVIVAELFNIWEVSVLLAAPEWNVRIRKSRDKLGSMVLDNVPKHTFWKRPQFGCTLLSQLHEGQGLVVVFEGQRLVVELSDLSAVSLFLLIAHLIVIN